MRLIRFLRKGDADLREVVNLAASGLVLRGMGAGLSLGIGVIVGRLLGADGAGLYFFAVSVVNVASIFGRVGFGNVLVRHIAESVTTGDWGSGRFVYDASLKVVGGVSAVIAVVIFATAPWSAGAVFHKPEYEIPLMLAAVAVIPFSLTWTEGDALRALRKIPSAQLTKAVLASLVTVALLYPLIRLWSANGAIVAFLLGTVVTAYAGHRLWLRAWNAVPGNTGERRSSNLTVRTLMVSSWALLGVALANMGIQNISSVIIGTLGSNADVGVFNVANRVASMLLLPLYGVVSILAPKFVQLNTRKDFVALEALVRRSSLLLLAVVVPAAAVVFVIASPVMAMFGPHFRYGVPILRILMIATVINTGTGPTGTVLVMSGHERAVWKLALLTLAVAVALCIGGQVFYGVVGLSWAMAFSIAMQNVVLVFLVKKHLGFWPLRLWPRSRRERAARE